MKTTIKRSSILSVQSELLVLPLRKVKTKLKKTTKAQKLNWLEFDPQDIPTLTQLDKATDGKLAFGVAHQEYKPNPGSRLSICLNNSLPKSKTIAIRLSGLPQDAFDEKLNLSDLQDWRKLASDAVREAESLKCKSVAVYLNGVSKKNLVKVTQAVSEGAMLGAYKYLSFKSDTSDFQINKLQLIVNSTPSTHIIKSTADGKSIAEAVCLARDLVNCPPSDMTPTDLVKTCRGIARKRSNRLELKVIGTAQLKRLGANAILGVSRGSSQPPYLIHMIYKPKTKNRTTKKLVLVGKGITFDSGGLSLKPSGAMKAMKCDMAGAAAVIATMSKLSELGVQHEVHGIIPTAENMVNGQSMKPGDVVKTIKGKTIEVLNTDAEGRLLLADAFGYAARIKADSMVDLATLTGACVAALGNQYAGIFTENDSFAKLLIESGSQAGEHLWRLPLAKEYRSLIKSSVADVKNIATGGPGAVIAALFLKEFVPDNIKWSHIDIAGPAFIENRTDLAPIGASGFGVRTLLKFCQSSQ